MKTVLKKILIIISIYLIFTFYLFMVSERIERLNDMDKYNYTNNKWFVIDILCYTIFRW